MAKEDGAKAGVDFEWVNSNAKDSKGNPVKTRRFFTRAEKKAMKEGKKPETKPAPAARAPATPAKDNKPTVAQRPKPRPEAPRATNGVRPEGKAAGMPPAKKDGKGAETAARAAAVGATVVGARAIAQAGRARPRKPAQAKPSNPSYTGRAGSPEGFRGRFETGLARAAGRGAGARRIGPGGRGRLDVDRAKDPLMLMAKGGMVKKKK